MRIMYVAEAFGGGVFELVRLVVAGVRREGHEVLLAYGVRPETPQRPADYFDERVSLVETPWVDRRPTTHVAAARKVKALARAWAPDVLHLYSTFAGVAGVVARPHGAATIYSPQAYSFTMVAEGARMQRLYRSVERIVSRKVTVVGAASESEAKEARGLGAHRVEVIRNGIPELDDPVWRPGVRNIQAVPEVVAAGRLSPQRQPEACARILAPLRDVAKVSWIGGAGSDTDRRITELTAMGIRVTGWLPRERVLEQLSNARAYLHWTAWDGLPLSILEALACDVPVVASDIPVNREILGDAQTFRSEREATDMLRRLVSDQAFHRATVGHQRTHRQRWSAERMVNGWIDLYKRAVR